MNSGFLLNSVDLQNTYDVRVTSTVGLYGLKTRKGELFQSWLDSDGDEAFYDANDIYFDGNDVIIHCVIVSDSFNTMKVKLNLLKLSLASANLHTFKIPNDATTHSNLEYIKGSRLEFLTPKNTSKVVARFWMQFRQVVPT